MATTCLDCDHIGNFGVCRKGHIGQLTPAGCPDYHCTPGKGAAPMPHKRLNPPTKVHITLGALAKVYDEPCPGDPDTMVTITATWTVDIDSDCDRTCQAVEGWAPGDFGMASDVEVAGRKEREKREKADFWARHALLRAARDGR